MDHPCFLDFFDSNRADDGFRPHGGLFCLFRSADICVGPRDVFGAGHTTDTCHYSRPGLESSIGKRRRQYRTIGIGVEAITKWTCLRACKHPEDAVELNLSVGLPVVCGSSFSKARSYCFGLFFYASELNLKKDGMKRIKRIFQILQEEKELYGELTHNIIKLAT